MSMQLLVFKLNNEEFGMDIQSISAILQADSYKIQPVPGTNAAIEGMVNVRGRVNYMFNLRTKFGLDKQEISPESKFIMLNTETANIGCIVDSVKDIVKIEEDQIEKAPPLICTVDENYIVGIGKKDGRLILILDPEQLLVKELTSMQLGA